MIKNIKRFVSWKAERDMKKMKPLIAGTLRKMHLLQLADYLLFVYDLFRHRKSNRAFLRDNPGFSGPPAALAYEAYNHTNWASYYSCGLAHAGLIAHLVEKHCPAQSLKICEWGCGPGRVIRHLADRIGFAEIELYGADYNEKTIKWCRENLPEINFAKNNLEPPLPYESEAFDCVYAISIFTHLSERLHYAWLKELLRVIKPNGVLIFTTHGDSYAERLLPADKEKYDRGMLVINDQVQEGKKHFAAYHPRSFVRDALLKGYLVVEHMENPASYQLSQEIWCIKK